MSHNSNVYVTEENVKGNKREIYVGEGCDSCEDTEKECQIISNDSVSESELKIEVKSEEESDENETAFLRKLKLNYANNELDEVQEMLHISDVYVRGQKMKIGKKREVYADEEHDSFKDAEKDCQIISNDDASGSEPDIEVKSEKEFSDEAETAILRKPEVKTIKKNCGKNKLNGVQEMSCNSNDDVTKSKKRQMPAEEIVGDASSEGSCKKRIKTNVQSKVVREPKGVNSGQVKRLTLITGFVWDADPSLLPAATASHKSDTSSDEELVHKVGR
jgi:hypothetical protein